MTPKSGLWASLIAGRDVPIAALVLVLNADARLLLINGLELHNLAAKLDILLLDIEITKESGERLLPLTNLWQSKPSEAKLI